ncbi:tetraacyldisaccharide-1-P 4'-kinase [Hyphomonas polymorpha PS728]|uniref:Tetraacyldisaccharide-1-P 4'-kinase n=1 Tax=Hyphomonas polymorpha PS728 TaxID=1280954 RepID=A0A062VBF3_9PROT|nr:M3 family metallopeptidase [Hyphomonas polymorpha]KCZ99737.1 tetraacyldisaccharide-1-P 4'-kinase [Hyphomonas polymorpha PS728]
MKPRSTLLASAAMTAILLAGACTTQAAAPETRLVSAAEEPALRQLAQAMMADIETNPASAAEFAARCTGGLGLSERILADLETRTAAPSLADLQDFDTLSNLIYSVGYGEAGLLAETNPDPEIRTAGEDCQQKAMDITTQVSLSRPVFDRLSAIDAAALDERSAWLLQRTLRDYRRAGVDRDEATRDKIRALNAELAGISTEFNRNLREIQGSVKVTPEALAGMPQDYIEAHAPGEDGLVTITTDYPDTQPVFTYSPNDAMKKDLARASGLRAYPENVAPLRGLLEKRYELANLLGYPNYAAYITEDKMSGSPETVHTFLNEVEAAARNASQIEFARLLAKKRESEPAATTIGDWSRAYLAEQIRQSDYDLNSQEVRKYFAYNNVRTGIFSLVEDLFGVEVRDWDGAPVWHESVTAHEMYKDGALMGRFFLDMHPREGKFKHAAAFPIRLGPTSEGVPVAALVCNFPAGDHSTGLMEHIQVETFLHEFGHLLHSMFSAQPDYASLNMGTVEWDFIEAPSQMLENWVWDYDTLAKFAVDADGNTIPPELVAKMNAARNFGKGVNTLRQLIIANTSLDYYNLPPGEVDLLGVMKGHSDRLSLFEQVPDIHPYASIGHFDGYSAIYYTYQWSLAISTDLFSVFEQNGLRDEATAARYRDLVLAPGSSKPAAQLVHDFLGRDWSPEAYEQLLLNAAREEGAN